MLVAIDRAPPPDILEVLYAIEPGSFERARRVKFAMELLHQGKTRKEVSGEVFRKFGVSRSNAWLVVSMAVDMAG